MKEGIIYRLVAALGLGVIAFCYNQSVIAGNMLLLTVGMMLIFDSISLWLVPRRNKEREL